jgi:hypothetical protein
MIRLVLAAFFLETGLALLLVPWSSYWDRNYFAEAIPPLHAAITNNYVRGAVSGLGLLNVVAGITELLTLFAAQRSRTEIVSLGRTSADHVAPEPEA